MIPKLDGACCRRADGLEPLWSRGEERARNSGSLDQVVAILGQTADAALDEFGSRPGAPRMARRLLEDLTAHRGGAPEEAGAEEILARGLATAHDEAPWDARRALGESWRRIYPGLVDWVERLGPRDWERATFHRLCREMERLAFGPPAEVARQLLDGIRSGRVEVSAEAAGVAEVRVNAVLPGPGIAPEAAPPWSSLLACGAARTFRGTGGVQIRVDGQIMGRRGRPTRGLYAVGRPTEGSVLGNDTLSRCLHRHPARWAAGVLERARSSRSRSGLGTSTRSFSS
jgi:diaminopimelate decarboxylase